MEKTLSQAVKSLSYIPMYKEFFNKATVIITREDGSNAWSSETDSKKMEQLNRYSSSIGSAWRSMKETMTDEDTSFTLSFNNSQTGTYVSPIHLSQTQPLLGILFFKEEINPGKMKSDFKNFTQDLTVALSQNTHSVPKELLHRTLNDQTNNPSPM